MKKLLFGLLFVFVGLIAAVLVAPNFINWNEYRDIITEEVNAATGFNLEIRGDIKISILPSPALVINDVHVANIEGASSADTLSVKSFEVRVALAPLLGRQLKINSIKLVKPVLSLEILADGRTNMAIKVPAVKKTEPGNSSAPASQPFGSLTGGSAGGDFAVQVDNFVIEKGSITYRDDTKGQVETIENLNGRFALASLSGPMESSGSAVVRGTPMSFAASAGAMIQGRTLPFNFSLKVIPGEVDLGFSGALIRLDQDPQVKGKLKVDGKNLSDFVSAIAGGATLPASLALPFGASATLAGAASGGTLSDLMVKFNGTQGIGKIAVKLGDMTDLNVQLAINKLDADAFLTPQDQKAKPVKKSKKKAGAKDANKAIPLRRAAKSDGPPFSLKSLPKNLTAALNISVGAITFKNSVVRLAKVDATFEDQEITISQASALLPGSTDVGLLGTISDSDKANGGRPSFDGTVDLATNNLRGFLNWLGVDASAIAKDRLRKLTFAGKVFGDAKAARLRDIAVQLDSSRMTGAANIAFRARPSFGVDLAIDRLNLDGYLPREPALKSSSNSGSSARSNSGTKKAPAQNPPAQNPLAGLAALGDFDANINVALKSLVVNEVPIKDLRLAAKIYDGALVLTEFRTANAAGLAVNVSGTITGLKSIKGIVDPSFDDFKFNIRGKSLARLFSLAKITPPVPAVQIGRVHLSGTISGKPRALKVTTNTAMLGGTFTLNGLVEPLRATPRVDGKFSATHPNLVRLVRRLGSSYQPARKKIGGIDLRGRIIGDGQKMRFPELSGKAAGITLQGSAATDLTGPRPKITADLKTSSIVIDDILPAKQTAYLDQFLPGIQQAFKRGLKQNALLVPVSYRNVARAMASNPLMVKTAARDVTRRVPPGAPWKTTAIDLSFLKGFDGDIKLRSDSLRFQKYRVDEVSLASLLTDGVVDLSQLTGKAYGGRIKIDGRVIAAEARNQFQTRFEISDMDTGLLLSSLGTKGFRKGALKMVGEFRTVGRSTLDLVRALGGGGTISVQGLDISSAAKSGSALSGFANLFLSLQRFGSTLTGGKAGSKLADFSTSFRMEKGIARFEDMSLRSGLGNGAAKGFVDLPNWQINTAGEIELSENILAQVLLRNSPKKPVLPFKIYGRLDEPKVDLKTSALTKGGIRLPGSLNKKLDKLRKKKGLGSLLDQIFPQAKPGSPNSAPTGSPAGSPTGAPPPQQAPQQPQQQPQQQPKVEDFLKGILRGLGR